MSDVVAVGIITAGSTIIVAAIGAFATYKVSVRGAQTTVATADKQAGVELAKLEAENERLYRQYHEDDRRDRRALYAEFVLAADVMRRFGQVPGVSDEEFVSAQDKFLIALAKLELVSSK
jgi:hypothetical protein